MNFPNKEIQYQKTKKMETSHDLVSEDEQTGKQPVSLTQYSQMHPYQYLKQLNNIYQKCNKTSGKDFSSASMIKLPWKKFKPVSIPKIFQETYNLQRKQTYVIRSPKDNQNTEEVEKQRKFWMDHEDLMKKYYRNNLANNTMVKHKHAQRRKQLFSAKSCKGLRTIGQNFSPSRNLSALNSEQLKKPNNIKKNQKNTSTLKGESDKSIQGGFTKSKEPIYNNFSSPSLLKESANSKQTKKRLQRLKHINGQIPVEEQVLEKLRKISCTPHLNSVKTNNLLSKQNRGIREKQRLDSCYKKAAVCRDSFEDSRVKEGEYLEFNMKQDLIKRYKNKITQIDCSISEKNVKKTAAVLKEMQDLYSINIEDY